VQIVFAAIALLIGLCYAYGAFVQRRPTTPAPRAAAL
jgi:Na+-transporting methylmalonyl-CoA/oxaloacetate decarboxylase gamma subunit